MPRPALRNDEQSIDTHVVAVAQIARREPPRGRDNPAQPPPIQPERGGIFGGARLDLDKGEDLSAPRYYVDFAAGHTRTPGEDAPAVEPEIPAGEGLGAAAAPLGGLSLHLARSRARA